jgi:hypothetical protein
MPRTRLLDHCSKRRDDDQLIALIQELPTFGSARRQVFKAGLLNEAGELYREVHLNGEYDALLFTARMNASGFHQVKRAEPYPGNDYETVFAKR